MLAIAVADLVLMRRHPVSARPRELPEKIGLSVEPEDEGLRVQWDSHSRPIRNADRAILYIVDGTTQSRLDLSGRELDGSSVMYRPESERVDFRLEVYRGHQRFADSVAAGTPSAHRRRKQPMAARASVERLRPSPFERTEPLIVKTNMLPPPVALPVSEPEAAPEPPTEGRAERMLNKIPLLRRLTKHSQSDETPLR